MSCWHRSKTVKGQDRALEKLQNTDQRHQTSCLQPELAVMDGLHTKRTTKELRLQGQTLFAVYVLGSRDLPYQMRHLWSSKTRSNL